MSYQVIARKYRPQKFADVVGQEHVTQTLTNAIAQGRLAHAYLFAGPRGTGKTTIARIVKHLVHIAGLEKVKIDDAALYAIARGAEGGMRDAESTLDQLISFCGDKIEEADVLSMFGLTAQSQILELARAILAGEIETALRQLDELVKHGKDLGRLLSDLLNHFRNLLIYQVSRGDLKMLEVSEAEAAALAEQSKLAGSEGFTRILEVFGDAERRLRDAASKKILIEVALV